MPYLTQQTWHLTPSGWQEGDLHADADGVTSDVPRPTPEDRVRSGVFTSFQESASAPADTSWGPTWTHPDAARVAALVARFGDNPWAKRP